MDIQQLQAAADQAWKAYNESPADTPENNFARTKAAEAFTRAQGELEKARATQ